MLVKEDVAVKKRYKLAPDGSGLDRMVDVPENASNRPASTIVRSPGSVRESWRRRSPGAADARLRVVRKRDCNPGRVEMIHMMRKRQARYAYSLNPSIAEQLEIIAAA